jgi:hypothetical protein
VNDGENSLKNRGGKSDKFESDLESSLKLLEVND